MSISKVYMLGPVVTESGQINQIQDYSLDPGFEMLMHRGDGQVDDRFVAVLSQTPRFGFSTTAIARALGIAALGGLAITDATDFYFQKVAAGGTRSGGTTSLKFTGSDGILVPRTLQADLGSPARLQMEAIFVSSDGATAPLAYSGSGTLPTITDTDQAFEPGPVAVNGTTIEGIQSITVDFGIDLAIVRGSGEAFPTFVGIRTRRPSMSCRTTDVGVLGSDSGRAAQGATDSVLYLRKIAELGTRVADATTQHVKFTMDDGMIYWRTIGGGAENTEQMTEITFSPSWDGTNDVVAISTASAIT